MALTVFAEGPASLDPQKALYIPVGAASPLWFLFAGAASAGLAYWWMTRWTDRTHLEALLAPAADALPPEPAAEVAETAAIAGAMVDQALQTVAEVAAATLEPAAEPPTVETAPEPSAKLRAKPGPADEPSPDA